jgi:phosphomannomutase/phosphoglucomutase
MSEKLFGTNGVRGVANETMTAEVAMKLGASLGTYLKRHGAGSTVAVARDTRVSGEMLKSAAISGLLAAGCRVVDTGIMPTPTLQFYVRAHADAGVMITASHNPREYNGLKIIAGDGTEFSREAEGEVEKIYYSGEFFYADWSNTGDFRSDSSAVEEYINGILSAVDARRIREAKLKVVVDTGCGAGSVVTPFLMRRLGCEVVSLNAQIDGTFPSRNPEPTEDALGDLISLVKDSGADLGIAHDGDADRIALVDEKGVFVDEEVLLAMMADHVLSQEKGAVVTPVSSSLRIADVVRSHDCDLVWTAVGSINVARKMRETGAVFGGEGNGGLIFPKLQYCRDGAMSAAKILELISEGVKLSELVKHVPEYHMLKVKLPIRNPSEVMAAVGAKVEGERVDKTDGLKVWYDDGWVLVRPSGTEPLVRIYAESKSEKRAEELLKHFEEVVRDAGA